MGTLAQKGKKGLSVRAQLTKANLLAGMPLEPAMIKAGYSPGTARKQGLTTVTPIKRDLAAALERRGLTDDKLAKHIDDALHAKDEVYFAGTLVGDAKNWAARVQAINTCVKVRGDAAPVQVEHSGSIEIAQKRAAHAATVNRLAGYLE